MTGMTVMNKFDENSKDNDLRQDMAIEWFARLRRPDVTENTQADFQQWLDEYPENYEAYAEVESLWGELGAVQRTENTTTQQTPAFIHTLTSSLAQAYHDLVTPKKLAALASVLIAVSAVVFFRYSADIETPVVNYTTDDNSPQSINLADGSNIYLYGHSSIDIKLGERLREVTLHHGAGIFDVIHDPQRGFEVSTSHGTVKVVGTIFDVHTNHNNDTVTVISGKVRIALDSGNGTEEITLLKGSRAFYNKINGVDKIAQMSEPPTPQKIDDINKLVYEDAPLETVVFGLNKHFRQKIWLGDDSLKDLKINAVVELENENAVIKGMERAFSVKAMQISDNLIVFYPDAVD